MSVGRQLHRAAVAHFESQREEAIAVLQLYFTSPSAVGDHPGLVGDIVEWTSKIAEAEDALRVLSTMFRFEENSQAPMGKSEPGS
tara:strand:+ start:567 stop:821 length:255 start_codon:yes stop_codon:yes gene_type:complete